MHNLVVTRLVSTRSSFSSSFSSRFLPGRSRLLDPASTCTPAMESWSHDCLCSHEQHIECTAHSAAMRASCCGAGVLQRFIREFFDQNPLSHLGVVAMRNGTAQRLTELSASPVGP